MNKLLKNQSNYFKYLIFFELILLILIFEPINLFGFNLIVKIDSGDGPSYLNFPLNDAKLALSHHRTIGLPFFLKLYQYFDTNLNWWPLFNYIFYVFSINCFYCGLSILKFKKEFSFICCFFLLISFQFFQFLNLWTEIISISFCLISLSVCFFAIKKNSTKYYFLFAFLLFYTYQIRPSFVIFVFFPVCFYFFSNLFSKSNFNLKLILASSFLPLILFLIIRFIIVGSFGLVSFNGGPAANGMIYLETTDISKLAIANQKLAIILNEKREKLDHPCNIEDQKIRNTYSKKKLYGQDICFNEYFMLAWIEAIYMQKKIYPFKQNDKRNYNPWKYFSTMGFYWNRSGTNIKEDKILLNFGMDVYNQNKLRIFKRLFKSPLYFLDLTINTFKHQILIFLIMICVLFLMNFNFKIEKNTKKELSIFCTFFILIILNIIILYIHQNGEIRAVLVQNFFFLPILFAFLFYKIFARSN